MFGVVQVVWVVRDCEGLKPVFLSYNSMGWFGCSFRVVFGGGDVKNEKSNEFTLMIV